MLGPVYSGASISSQLVLRESAIPQISGSATSPELSNKENYPSFSRTAPSDAYQGVVIAKVCSYFQWTRVGLLSSTDSYGSNLGKVFLRAAKDGVCQHACCLNCRYCAVPVIDLPWFAENIKVLTAQSFEGGEKRELVRVALQLIKSSGANIIVLFAPSEESGLREPWPSHGRPSPAGAT